MIQRGFNSWRLAELERLVTSGSIIYPDLALADGRLLDEAEVEHVNGLLELHRRGLLSPALPSEAVLATLPARLATWLRANRPPAEVVTFAEEHVGEDIPAAFESAGGEGRAQSIEGKPHWRSPKAKRERDRKFRAQGRKPLIHGNLTKTRARKLAAAEAAKSRANGNLIVAAAELMTKPKTVVKHLAYRDMPDPKGLMPPLPNSTAKKQRKTKQSPTREPEPPTLSDADPELLAKVAAAIASFKQQQ